MDLTSFRVLSFDCYGTLIDWETGLLAVLRPWADEGGLGVGDDELLETYGSHEAATERERPGDRYPSILAESFRRVGRDVGREVSAAWASRLGASVGDWPAFPDSAAALDALATRYDLVIVSNVHRDGFAASNERLRGRFAAIITAEDVGAYKPADAHFAALRQWLDARGVDRSRSLHVAQSLFHDHVPAAQHGLASVWIDRRHARSGSGATPTPDGDAPYAARYESMAAFAAAVDSAFT